MFTPFAYRATKAVAEPVAPGIITAGLIRYYNAGDTNSYPGSGTTWTDLQGSGYNLTLTNGPTFTSSGGGSYFTFDGADDEASGNDAGLPTSNNARTIMMWCYRLDPADFESMFSYGTQNFFQAISAYQTAGYSPYNRGWLVDVYGGGFGGAGQWQWPDTTWSLLGFHMDSSGYEITYNGVSQGTGTNPTVNTTLSGNLKLAKIPGLNNGYMRIAQFMFYDTKLSAADALTNFDATKANYGY